ncbi:hypothetical protein A5819_002520 [Enterococcus sp. 7E2_DIV0204]|uniref:hypothetical protein n=1 Tax=unclassified Enterococcus TaxID=2608891 RepID=UPI000A33DBC7|nr:MULTISPECIES: hypothetical protein [unclassified Enterococcus]OTN90021.1 hypothetical protein A5819_002520 [Enterococcus sp. 7E2_DIV0204]OTP52478.1 hypothetical protein A5884_001680 [Enterococcus sp. 7D2_DIV0200]
MEETNEVTSSLKQAAEILSEFSKIAQSASQVSVQLANAIGTVAGAMDLLSVSSGLVSSVLSEYEKYGQAFVNVKDYLVALNTTLGGEFLNNITNTGNKMSEYFSTMDSTATTAMSNFRSAIEESGGIVPFFQDKISGMVTSTTELFGGMVTSVSTSMKSFRQSAMVGMNGFKLSIANAGGIVPFFQSQVANMVTGAMGAFQSFSAFLLGNPIGVGLALIIGAVVAMTVAWKSNFNNIQGFVSSAFNVIKGSVTSLAPVFNQLMAVLKPVGAFLIQTLVVAAAAVVDAFRFLVVTVMSVVNGFMTLLTLGKSVGKLLSGDFSGAGEEFNKVKDSISGIVDDFKNLGENSAVKGVLTESTKELGKEATITGDKVKEMGEAYKTSLDEAGTRIDNLKSKYSEVGQAAITAFSGEGLEQSTTRFEAAEQIMGRHADNLKSIKEKVGEELAKSDELTGEKQIAAQSNAYSMMITQASVGASEMLTIANANKEMLLTNKTLEGQELSEEQRKTLQDQNNAVREGLMEQQQLIIEASQEKLALGQQLSATELEATISATQALYQNRKDQMLANEAEIAALQQQVNETSDEVQKANLNQQLTALTLHNEQAKEQQALAGADMLTMLQQNEQLKAETVSNGLKGMGEMTGLELANIVSKYAESNNNVNDQMTVLAGILQSRGLDASDALLTALQSGDLTQVGSQLSQNAIEGISNLPNELFLQGDIGKNKLIEGLKAGELDATEVGALLISSMNTGSASKISDVQTGSRLISTAGSDALKQGEGQHKASGVSNAGAYVGGITQQASNAGNAGRVLAVTTGNAAGSVDFYSIGFNMAAGVANGIREGQGAAVEAMRQLVSAVNEEAKKKAEIKSPSRLFRDTVGKFIAQGVAVGIEEDTAVAVASARNMVTEIQDAVSDKNANMPTATLKVEHDVQNSMVNQMHEMIETIKNMKVVLESGALVGGIGNQMDGFLGNQAGYAGRYR